MEVPDWSREQIEEHLFEALVSAGRRYDTGAGSVDEYVQALKRFADFVVAGTVPADIEQKAKPAASEKTEQKGKRRQLL